MKLERKQLFREVLTHNPYEATEVVVTDADGVDALDRDHSHEDYGMGQTLGFDTVPQPWKGYTNSIKPVERVTARMMMPDSM
jgi:hypothetical protein